MADFQNPFLRGMYGAQESAQRRDAGQISQLGGLLSIQNAIAQQEEARQMNPLKREQLQMAVARARLNNRMIQEAAGGQAPQGNQPLAFGAGGVSLPGGGQGNVMTGQAVPQATSAQPAGGLELSDQQIRNYLLSGDPGLKATAEAALKMKMERMKPVVNRGFGIGTMNQQGQYVPDPASLTQALDLERGKQRVQLPYRPPVSMPTSGGQNVNVFPQEFPAIQAGQVPNRLQPQPIPQAPPQGAQQPIPQAPSLAGRSPAELAAIEEVRSGRVTSARVPAPGGGMGAIPSAAVLPKQGLGQIGVSQPQSDVISQQRQTAAGKALDEQFAKDYIVFVNGGAQDAARQISQLKDVSAALGQPDANLTGPYLGSVPDVVKKFSNPASIAARERVEEVVQRSLRVILGAQFTEKEGERLIARAYNPDLPESENKIRVDRLMKQLEQALQNKTSAAQYFEQNKTLEGWQGKLPTIGDFDPAPPQRGTSLDFNGYRFPNQDALNRYKRAAGIP